MPQLMNLRHEQQPVVGDASDALSVRTAHAADPLRPLLALQKGKRLFLSQVFPMLAPSLSWYNDHI